MLVEGGDFAMIASPADFAACEAAIRTGSRTFHAASLLLPARVRLPALALYAFCRMADDAIDGSGQPRSALTELERRLSLAYQGTPVDAFEDRALASVVAQFGIPMEIPAALLEGFAWDAEGRRYEDLSGITAYAVRVAGAVGVMMSLLMGVRSPHALARAADLGVAMQFSNIARDVGEDARAGRLYLPLEWLREAGLDARALLERPEFDARLGSVVDRLLESAERLYARAAAGVAELPAACRPAIHAARLMYAEIGHEVARSGGDSISRRAVVPGRRKAVLMARALTAAAGGRPFESLGAALPEAQYLIDAVQSADAQGWAAPDGLPDGRFARDLIWVIELFARLERREHMTPEPP